MITNVCATAIIFGKMTLTFPAVPADAKLIEETRVNLVSACCTSEEKEKFEDCESFMAGHKPKNQKPEGKKG